MLIDFLRNEAKQKGITHDQIAEKTGFQPSNVSRMLTNKYSPSLPNFLKLAEATGVRLELHSDTGNTGTTKVRNIDVDKFLFSSGTDKDDLLYILHTHYPACLIQVIFSEPITLTVVENYDTSDDLSEVLTMAMEFFFESFSKL